MSARPAVIQPVDTPEMPADVLTENLVLGGIISSHDPECFARVSEILNEPAFFLERNRVLFVAMRRIFDSGMAINLGTLRSELARCDFFQTYGGISDIVDGMPALMGIENFCRIVAEKHRLRTLIETLDAASTRAYSQEESEDIIVETQRRLHSIEQSLPTEEGTNAPRIFEQAGGINTFISPEIIPGIMSPWERLNEATNGLKPGEIYILGGRPGTGKTSMALQIGANAMINGHRVAFASYEMTPRALMHRLVCSHARVDSRLARGGHIDRLERERLLTAAHLFEEHQDLLTILDPKKKTTSALASYARKQRIAGKPVNLLIVDYLQRMRGVGRYENRALEVASISSDLTDITKDHDLAVLALSQLKRDFDTGDRQPEMSDVAESGGIERDADFMGILKLRDAEQLTKRDRDVDLYIVKQRNGPTGKIQFKFETIFCSFQQHERPESRWEVSA